MSDDILDLAFPCAWSVSTSFASDSSIASVSWTVGGESVVDPTGPFGHDLLLELAKGDERWTFRAPQTGLTSATKVVSTWDPELLIYTAGGIPFFLDCKHRASRQVAPPEGENLVVYSLVPMPEAECVLFVEGTCISALRRGGFAWSWESLECRWGDSLCDLEVVGRDEGSVTVRGWEPASGAWHRVSIDLMSGRHEDAPN